jgi:UDP-glucose 4-epimerase
MVDKILVTGGAGFIGSHLIDSLVKNYEVYSLDAHLPGFGNKHINPLAHQINGDIRRYEDIEFALKNIDYVIHLAAISHVSTCINDPKLAFSVNVQGTVNLLEACRKQDNIKRVVVAASDHIYGKKPAMLPVCEKDEYKALYENDVYGKTKAMQAVIAKMYNDFYKVPTVVTVSGNVYSSRQSKPNMVPMFIDAALNNTPITIHGHGNQTRDVYYISDLVRGYIKCLETPRIEGELFNFGSGRELSVNDMASKIIELTHSKSEIIHSGNDVYNAMDRMSLEIRKARILLDWRPKISLEEGLKLTINETINGDK